MSVNSWVDNENVVYKAPYKIMKISICKEIDGTGRNYIKWNKQDIGRKFFMVPVICWSKHRIGSIVSWEKLGSQNSRNETHDDQRNKFYYHTLQWGAAVSG